MTAIGDSSVDEEGIAAVWTTVTVTVAANDGGVVEIRLYLTRYHNMQELSTY